MPKTEIDYSNTIIYKITCNDKNVKEVYVGHTTNFVQRKYAHKQNCTNAKGANYNCKLYKVIRENGGWANWTMEIVNFFNCEDHYDARKKEQEHFELLNATLNSIEPMPKPKVFKSYKNFKNAKNVVSNNIHHDPQVSLLDSTSGNLLEILETKTCQKNAETFLCAMCDFSCSKKSNFDSHLLTRKHKKNENGNPMETLETACDEKKFQKCQKMPSDAFTCEFCEKSYKNKSGLWKHSKICHETAAPKQESKDNELISKLIQQNMDLVSQNQEFKQMMVEQNKTLLEIANKTTIVNNNNTTNNNKFNLNIFLNEKCKDALNIMDFVNSLQLQMEDLEETGRLGYIQGISRIFINGLKQLDVYKRPIHCSDVKRETLYVKDNNAWEKEDADKKKITRAIRHVSIRNAKQINEWTKGHKGYNDSMHKNSDKYLKLIREANGGDPHELNKIIKNISGSVTIDKEN